MPLPLLSNDSATMVTHYFPGWVNDGGEKTV